MLAKLVSNPIRSIPRNTKSFQCSRPSHLTKYKSHLHLLPSRTCVHLSTSKTHKIQLRILVEDDDYTILTTTISKQWEKNSMRSFPLILHSQTRGLKSKTHLHYKTLMHTNTHTHTNKILFYQRKQILGLVS